MNTAVNYYGRKMLNSTGQGTLTEGEDQVQLMGDFEKKYSDSIKST
jgi:hypothetical protein